jgi:hypothetical protein
MDAMKKKILLDIFFYLAVPLLSWNLLRGVYSDYHIILFGMMPAVLYTVFSFFHSREWNITGMFFLGLITLNFGMNVISETAEEELWNSVWMGYISIAFYALTIAIKRPIGIYFFIDYAFSRGVPREKSAALYKAPENFHHFFKFTLFLILREAVVIVVKSSMIKSLGVEGFNQIQVTTTTINYAFTALMIFYIIRIIKMVKPPADS